MNVSTPIRKADIQSFLQFIDVDIEAYQDHIIDIFYADRDNSMEVLFDRGRLLVMKDGHLVDHIKIESVSQRHVKFDGREIVDLNPEVEINGAEIEV